MHTNEVCVIPCDNGNLEKEFAISTEVDLWCEIELLSFFKVCVAALESRTWHPKEFRCYSQEKEKNLNRQIFPLSPNNL